MKISKATNAFLSDISTNRSPSTVTIHRNNLAVFMRWLGDKDVTEVNRETLNEFIVYLREKHIPFRFATTKRKGPLSGSAIHNYWKTMRVFFAFCSDVLRLVDHPEANLKYPKYQLPEVQAFKSEEIKKILHHAEYGVDTNGRVRKLPSGVRNKAIVMVLFDTGLRLGELCRLTVTDFNQETGDLLVAPHGSGQKTKPRTVFVGRETRRAIWAWFAKRSDYSPEDSLFNLSPKHIRHIIWEIGRRAGVPNCHPHKFRHTFGIEFLRGGGDSFTLQKILGHSTLDMTSHYVHVLEADIRRSQAQTSIMDRINKGKLTKD